MLHFLLLSHKAFEARSKPPYFPFHSFASGNLRYFSSRFLVVKDAVPLLAMPLLETLSELWEDGCRGEDDEYLLQPEP